MTCFGRRPADRSGAMINDHPTRPQPREPTLRELGERYRSECIDVYLKPRTASNYPHYLDTYILPALGDRPPGEPAG